MHKCDIVIGNVVLDDDRSGHGTVVGHVRPCGAHGLEHGTRLRGSGVVAAVQLALDGEAASLGIVGRRNRLPGDGH